MTSNAIDLARKLAEDLDLPLIIFRTGGNDGTAADPDTVFGVDTVEKLERVVLSRLEQKARKGKFQRPTKN